MEAVDASLLEVVGPDNMNTTGTVDTACLMVDLTPNPMEDTVDKGDAPPPYHTVVPLPPPYSSVSG